MILQSEPSTLTHEFSTRYLNVLGKFTNTIPKLSIRFGNSIEKDSNNSLVYNEDSDHICLIGRGIL